MNQIWSDRSSKIFFIGLIFLLSLIVILTVVMIFIPKKKPMTKVSTGVPVKSTQTISPLQYFQGNISSVSASLVTVKNSQQTKTFTVLGTPTVQKTASGSSVPAKVDISSVKLNNQVLVMYDVSTMQLKTILVIK